MADSFEIEIATPDRLLVRDKAIRAQIPGRAGYLGVLPDHAPLLSELGIGALTYTTPGDHRFSLAIKHGFVEILDNHVRVLADDAERGNEIDVTKAEKDLKHAQDAIINPNVGLDIASALIAMRHAQAKIDAARKALQKEE
ncbi:MAG TPA: ATP synthase F1 subunit epsilon [Bryobacteraceae bacterium]|nr:ATP synthase F1 subunit epsilon [Bryobacteraceae bacterium]